MPLTHCYDTDFERQASPWPTDSVDLTEVRRAGARHRKSRQFSTRLIVARANLRPPARAIDSTPEVRQDRERSAGF